MAIRCGNPACGHLSDNDAARFCARCGAALPAAAPAAAGPLVGQDVADGRYHVMSLLAEGGMGRVYLAAQRGVTGRKVAFKTILPDLKNDPGLVERFLREVALASQLDHPNVVRVYDSGTLPDGTLFVAMEYVEGESLAEVIAAGRLPVARVEPILRQLASALAAAHELGIVHRDLKPDNVLLARRGARADVVKVVDFGIARQQGTSAATRAGLVLGTPRYMAPEQFSQSAVTPAADQYALGVMTYEMITGAMPFRAETPWEWMLAHGAAAPIPFEAHGPVDGLLPRHRDAVLRALAKQPGDRFASVLAFVQAFTGDPAAGSGWTEGFSTAHGAPAPPGVQHASAAPAWSAQGGGATHAATAPSVPPWAPVPPPAPSVPPTVIAPFPASLSQPPQSPTPPPRGGAPSLGPWIGGVLIGLGAAGVVVAVLLSRPRSSPSASPPAPATVAPPATDVGPPAVPVPTGTPVVPAPAQAPADAAPQPPPDPLAAQRAQVAELLDQIEAQLAECEADRMEHVTPQARRIEELAGQMAEPVAAFPRAARPYEGLRDQARRFITACELNDHADMHSHHGRIRRFAADVRAAL